IVGDEDDRTPLVWPSATAGPIRLPLPAGATEAAAVDIDEDGTVAGTVDKTKAYVWFADGTHRQLAMPVVNGKPAVIARLSGIRNGWATGVASSDMPLRKDGRPGADPKAAAKGAQVGKFSSV